MNSEKTQRTKRGHVEGTTGPGIYTNGPSLRNLNNVPEQDPSYDNLLDSMDTSPTVFSSSLPPSLNLIVEDSHDIITDIQDLDFDYYQDDTTLLDEGNNNDLFYDDNLDHPHSPSPPSRP
ncbi:hypothetical protein EV424DRAFT_1538180 [Suillus variegatus]|nr:hypothetical protein EV424DRAFT_1538180 [Suillus variegatus]